MAFQVDYNDCEKELQRKTEEVETLKTENKDLKEIIKLEKILSDEAADIPVKETETKDNPLEEEQFLKMKSSGLKRKSQFIEPGQQAMPNKRPTDKSKDKEYNFNECDFQGTRELELKKHIDMKHSKPGSPEGKIKCYHCDNQFSTRWNLMSHRKSIHPDIVAVCKNYQANANLQMRSVGGAILTVLLKNKS